MDFSLHPLLFCRSTSILYLSVQPTWFLSASCLRRTLPGPPPTTKRHYSSPSNSSPTPLPPSHWPTWAWMSPLWSSLYTASSALEWNSDSPPLESSKKLRGWWEEASRWPVGIQSHFYLCDRGFSLHADEKTVNKCWPQAADVVVMHKIVHSAEKDYQ